ncbi:ATP-binding cassette domain-containing protein [Mesorhizobium sp. M0244]
MVFQSPDRTLNPRQKIGRILGRPLRRLAGLRRRDVKQHVSDLLASVRLASSTAEQKSRSLSGGQRQRAAIARAFAGVPKIVVLDEPTSALDVSIQATVLNLLNDLQRDKDTTYLFISQDLRVVRYMADRISVLYRSRLDETGSSDQIFRGPNHPYTKRNSCWRRPRMRPRRRSRLSSTLRQPISRAADVLSPIGAPELSPTAENQNRRSGRSATVI